MTFIEFNNRITVQNIAYTLKAQSFAGTNFRGTYISLFSKNPRNPRNLSKNQPSAKIKSREILISNPGPTAIRDIFSLSGLQFRILVPSRGRETACP